MMFIVLDLSSVTQSHREVWPIIRILFQTFQLLGGMRVKMFMDTAHVGFCCRWPQMLMIFQESEMFLDQCIPLWY